MARDLRSALGLLGLMLLLLPACANGGAGVPSAMAAPNVFSGPVNGGCYLESITSCRIHIDAWQPIVTDTGTKLIGFQLLAFQEGALSGQPIYDFRTDVSNPPLGSYVPSLVKKDFAAQCGVTYHLALQAKDSGDPAFEEVGQTTSFQCPAAATPTASPTPTATPEVTPNATSEVTPTATPEVTPNATPEVTPTTTPEVTPTPGWELKLPVVISG